MKKVTILLASVALLFVASCKKSERSTSKSDSTTIVTQDSTFTVDSSKVDSTNL